MENQGTWNFRRAVVDGLFSANSAQLLTAFPIAKSSERFERSPYCKYSMEQQESHDATQLRLMYILDEYCIIAIRGFNVNLQ
jgi:hypothetical protein